MSRGPKNYPVAFVRADTRTSTVHPPLLSFVDVVWGTPSAESANSIEITATCHDLNGNVYATGEVSVTVVASDGAATCEPSPTTTLSAASSPVGTLLAGGGTATAVFKTNASGQFRLRVTEAAAGNRFLWVQSGGHHQLFVKARDGVQQLTFS